MLDIFCKDQIKVLLTLTDQNKSKINAAIKKIEGKFRILFSAHGLPEYIIKAGDPYQWQVEASVNEVIDD